MKYSSVFNKIALGAMLASSVAMFASNPIKTARTDNLPQTEVVSKDGAEALKVMTFPGQQQTPAVPTVHNKALDEKFLKFCENPEEVKMVTEFINNIYNQHGIYLGSATIQQNIDLNMFMAFLDGNIDILKRFDEDAYNKIDRAAMQKVVEKSEPIKQWLNENYFNVYNQPFGQFDHPPDYEELDKVLTDYMISNPNKLFGDGIEGMLIGTMGEYKQKLKCNDMDESQKKFNLIAFKMSIANYMLFLNLIKQAGIYIDYKDFKAFKNFKIFMETVRPEASL